jgi:hypothetical protein
MHSLGILFVVASVASPLGTLPPALTQDAAPEPAKEVKQEFLLWQRRQEFAGAISDARVRARLGDKPVKDMGGDNLQSDNIKKHLDILKKSHPNVVAGQATESEELDAWSNAYGEFVEVLIAARELATGNMEEYKRRQMNRAKKVLAPPPSPPARYSPFDTTPERAYKIVDHGRYSSDMAKWRGEISSRAQAAINAQNIDNKKADLEKAVRKTFVEGTKKFDEAYDRFLPAIVADELVDKYSAEILIESAKRIEVRTQTTVNLSDCRDKARIREVVYDVTDGFGVKRRGSVAVYLADPKKHEWKLSIDNAKNGGFYELRLAQANQ